MWFSIIQFKLGDKVHICFILSRGTFEHCWPVVVVVSAISSEQGFLTELLMASRNRIGRNNDNTMAERRLRPIYGIPDFKCDDLEFYYYYY